MTCLKYLQLKLFFFPAWWTHHQHLRGRAAVLVRTLRRAHTSRTWSRQCLKGAWTKMRQCKWLYSTECYFDIITQISRAYSSWQAQKTGSNCWLQRDKLRNAKTQCGLRKEVVQHIPNLQNIGFKVLHGADGCRQLYHDARMKGWINSAPQSKGQEHVCAPDRCDFWDAGGWRCVNGRSSGREIALESYTLRSKAPLP